MPAFTSQAFTRWRLPRLRLQTSNCSLLLIYLPRKNERLSRPGWLAYSGRFTHISGHPSAVGRAQDRESSPVKDQRYTNCATQPIKILPFPQTRIRCYKVREQVGTYFLWASCVHTRQIDSDRSVCLKRCEVAYPVTRMRSVHIKIVVR